MTRPSDMPGSRLDSGAPVASKPSITARSPRGASGLSNSRWLVASGLGLSLIAGIVLIERQQSLGTGRLLECLLVLALLAFLAWATRGVLRNILLVCCSFLVGLAVFEGGALLASKNPDRSGTVFHDSGLSQYRPLLGWGPTRPGVFHTKKTAADGRTIFDTHVTIDKTLNRKTVPSEGPRPLVFFGDSWIYGDGVNDDGTLPQSFADLTGRKIPVLNLSFAGWSPAQNLIALREDIYKELLDAPRHFILFASTFHLERTGCKGDYGTSQSPRLAADGSTVTYVGPCTGRFNLVAPLVKFARRSALFNKVASLAAQPSRQDVELYIKIVEAFVVDAQRKYGVATTVLFEPYSDPYLRPTGYTESQIVGALRKDGVDVLVDKLPSIADSSLYMIAGDGHPTALANKARAIEIRDYLRKVDPGALVAESN